MQGNHKGEQYNWLNGVMFFDIETEPSREMLESFMPEFSAPSNYKDPEKIQRYITEKKEGFAETAPLDLDFARIKAIGIATGNDVPAGHVADETESWSEEGLLNWFWQCARDVQVFAGYNIVGFDIPIIMRRSFALGIRPTRPLFGLKPWDKLTLDLMRAFYHDGYGPGVKYRGLKWICQAYEIETEWDVDEVDGSMVQQLTSEELRAYVVSDVAKTRALAVKMYGHYW
jgi:uncharacterized protein YprB with RNaseH-like and TPR domain